VTLRSWPRLAIAILAVGLGLYSLSVALVRSVEGGMAHDDAGTVVLDVRPDTFEWEAGLRVGQRIRSLRTGDQPGGWAIQTAEANGGQIVLYGPVELLLRASTTLALLAVALGVLAFPAARMPARRAELLATLGVVLAVVPIAIAYERTGGLLVIGAAVSAPWLWFVRWGGIDRRAARVVLAAGAALWAGWVVMRIADPVAAVGLRNLLGLWIGVSAPLLLVAGGRMTPRRVFGALATIQVVDVLVLAGAAIVALVLANNGVNLLLVVPVVLLPLVLLIGVRRQVADGLDRVLLAELRERAAIRATEDERARVSRELHDDPLQQITGVIRELESSDPDPAAATASLREVAARLRGVATELHPPVLDDLGILPAIEAVARQVTEPPVSVELTSRAGYTPAQRPPADVELAAFRIAQEAITNAARHAGATRIRVSGEVTANAIDLEVADDGRGLDQAAVEEAQRAGHMGIASMRGRAAAIGAKLRVEPLPGGGTAVTLRWRR
jgi:signal transduction histidine kinase